MNNTINGITQLSQISGLPESEIWDIAKIITENNKKLNSCSYHKFTKYDKKKRRWTCENCFGTVDSVKKKWYELGIKQAWNQPIGDMR